LQKAANIIQINEQRYNKGPRCPQSAFTQAHRVFLKFGIDLRIASCCKLFQIFINADFSSGMSFGCGFRSIGGHFQHLL